MLAAIALALLAAVACILITRWRSESRLKELEQDLKECFKAMAELQSGIATSQRQENQATAESLSRQLEGRTETLARLTDEKLYQLEGSLRQSLEGLRELQDRLAQGQRQENEAAAGRLSSQLDDKVGRLSDLTDKNLERIRATVDERLQESLEQKFSQVTQRLVEVHTSLGRVQELAADVGRLERTLSNTKSRGILGELQLEALLKDMLPASRYEKNVSIVPGSREAVEFALRIPAADNSVTLLPIDAKFPLEDYQRIQKAREERDADGEAEGVKALKARLLDEGRQIRKKYVAPPYSTDFAIMYLPSEGLFIEALNLPGFAARLQRECKVCLAGPTTFAALLNSLMLGLHAVTVQKKTAEVLELLKRFKTELAGIVKDLDDGARSMDKARSSLEASGRKLKKVDKLLKAIEEDTEEKIEA